MNINPAYHDIYDLIEVMESENMESITVKEIKELIKGVHEL